MHFIHTHTHTHTHRHTHTDTHIHTHTHRQTDTHTHTHINAMMGSQPFTHQRLGFAIVILFPNCRPTYKHKTVSVILFITCFSFCMYISISIGAFAFSKSSCALLSCTHIHTPCKCVACRACNLFYKSKSIISTMKKSPIDFSGL